MTQQHHYYEHFARLLEYPSPDYRNNISALLEQEVLAEPARLELYAFAADLESLSLTDIEELYTRTFDINPVSSLEVGWHLYGEQYERGSFLVKMRERLAAHGIPEGTELPDHVSSALRLCTVEENTGAVEFIASYLSPAIAKIQSGLVEKENPYRHVVAALQAELERKCSQLHGEEHHV